MRPFGEGRDNFGISIWGLNFNKDGSLLAAVWGSDVRCWDAATGKQLLRLAPDVNDGQKFTFTPDGKSLALVHRGTVRLVNAVTGQERQRLSVQHIPVDYPEGKAGASSYIGGKVAFSPNGKLLATAELDTIYVWDLATGKEMTRLKAKETTFNAFTFSPDSKMLLSGGNWWADDKSFRTIGMARVWDLNAGQPVHSLQSRATVPYVTVVAYSPDGELVATMSAGQYVEFWNAKTGKLVRTLADSHLTVKSFTFSPDGKTFATVGESTIHLWDVATGKLRRDTHDGHEAAVGALAISPDGRRIASGDDAGAIRFWETASGKLEKVLQGQSQVNALSFSPDAKTLAGGMRGATLGMWDVELGKQRHRLNTGLRDVTHVDFSPDGKTLVIGQQGWSGS